MRHYAPDTPEALARVVVAALLADGGLDISELESLENNAVIQRLGMSTDEFDRVVHDFCNDMQSTALRDHTGQLGLDRETIGYLLADVRAPELQMSLLRILLDIVSADGQLSQGELTVVSQAMMRWGSELRDLSSHRRKPPRWPPPA
jgi:uncharacterized tellurite resistance protein B-like protein